VIGGSSMVDELFSRDAMVCHVVHGLADHQSGSTRAGRRNRTESAGEPGCYQAFNVVGAN